jgi:hypothetical protein
LRLTSPVQNLARTTTRDVRIHGTTIPTGKKVLLCYAAANRDEDEFGPTAEGLDVERHLATILSFSHGTHYCIGAAAARLQGRVVLEELLARCPDFTVDEAAEPLRQKAITCAAMSRCRGRQAAAAELVTGSADAVACRLGPVAWWRSWSPYTPVVSGHGPAPRRLVGHRFGSSCSARFRVRYRTGRQDLGAPEERGGERHRDRGEAEEDGEIDADCGEAIVFRTSSLNPCTA